MIWTEAHYTMLVREILLFEEWEYRHRSPERGQAWENIADNLNKLANPKFKEHMQRSVRDPFAVLIKIIR